MKKIIDYIYMETSWLDKSWFSKAIYDNNIYFFIQIKQMCYKKKKDFDPYLCLIHVIPLLQVLLSLIIFITLYIFDIQLVSNNVIYIIKWVLSILFFGFMLRLLYIFLKGLFILWKNYEYDVLTLSFKLFCKLINFLINLKSIYWLLGLNIDLLLQYNIVVVIDIIMVVIIYTYINIYDYKIKGKKITTWLHYPWILIIISIISLLLGLKFNYYYGWMINNIFNEYVYVGKENED